ncbi:DUF3181 family protein [Leptolyngbya sp. PCC 6406]|uniref:DUF3181 family protein n=1 Tax=Leptolyngbya sp. PCC 6406 TaxID=1173264 RepID=UPI0002ABB0E6|nr:DUF3181 family protein [Leptolyngbya sp. PCC 6406]
MTSVPAETLEALAANIGEAVYIDVAKWHLYLNDAKLHTLLAEKFYPVLDENRLSEKVVTEVLQTTLIPIGAGRRSIPLQDLIPPRGETALLQALEDFQAHF